MKIISSRSRSLIFLHTLYEFIVDTTESLIRSYANLSSIYLLINCEVTSVCVTSVECSGCVCNFSVSLML